MPTPWYRERRAATLPWIVGGLVSAALLGMVLYQVDWRQAAETARGLSWRLLAGAACLYFAEGVATALRIRFFSTRRLGVMECLKANAWYVVSLVLLPARLGEVAGVIILQRRLGMSAGVAFMNIVAQRMLDVAVLSGIFLAASVLLLGAGNSVASYGIAAAIVALVAATLNGADRILGILAGFLLKRYGRRRPGFMRGTIALLLQARAWHRGHFDYRMIIGGVGLTVAKWGAHLGGFAMLLAALHMTFALPESLVIGAAYNFLAIVPLQTIGGLGVAEAGLTGLLMAFGIALPLAAGVTVLVRVFLIAMPFVFWLGVMAASNVHRISR